MSIAFSRTERESRVEAMGVFRPLTWPKPRLLLHLQDLTSAFMEPPDETEASDFKNIKGKPSMTERLDQSRDFVYGNLNDTMTLGNH